MTGVLTSVTFDEINYVKSAYRNINFIATRSKSLFLTGTGVTAGWTTYAECNTHFKKKSNKNEGLFVQSSPSLRLCFYR